MILRHRTVQDLVEVSHDLLAPDDNSCSRDCAVFAGSFGLDAVEEVCADQDLAVPACRCCSRTWWTSRWFNSSTRIFPTIDYWNSARVWPRRLGEDERDMVRSRHATWYLEVAERCARSLAGPDEAIAVKMLDRDFDNLRAAHLWSIEHSDIDTALRLVAGLREYSFRCMHAEITIWADAAIALTRGQCARSLSVAVGVAAYGRFVRGDLEGAIELGERAIAAADQLAIDGSGIADARSAMRGSIGRHRTRGPNGSIA